MYGCHIVPIGGKSNLIKSPTFSTICILLFESRFLIKDGPIALSRSLGVIIEDGMRIISLIPIAWDIWGTLAIEDIEGIEINCKCCVSS